MVPGLQDPAVRPARGRAQVWLRYVRWMAWPDHHTRARHVHEPATIIIVHGEERTVPE